MCNWCKRLYVRRIWHFCSSSSIHLSRLMSHRTCWIWWVWWWLTGNSSSVYSLTRLPRRWIILAFFQNGLVEDQIRGHSETAFFQLNKQRGLIGCKASGLIANDFGFSLPSYSPIALSAAHMTQMWTVWLPELQLIPHTHLIKQGLVVTYLSLGAFHWQ